MKVLVIGSGGREHALVWKIAQSKLADKIFCAPGNAGIANEAECIDINSDDIARLLDFAKREKIDLTVVGPEVPLEKGIVDEFTAGTSPLIAYIDGFSDTPNGGDITIQWAAANPFIFKL